jgi:muramoyltetrapeptide carboxypeptidase
MLKCRRPLAGDAVYVFAPASSMSPISEKMVAIGVANLARLGLRVKFGARVRATGPLGIATRDDRLSDIYCALRDPQVAVMMSVFGGYNSNQLLPALDFSVVRQFPKLWVGYSDISALLNALHAQLGMPGICGMGFASFCDPGLTDEALTVFKKILDAQAPLDYAWPARSAEDLWFLKPDLGPRDWHACDAPASIRHGRARGIAAGGNFDTLMALAGTRHMPSLAGKVLFLESAFDESPGKFLRLLTQLTQQVDFNALAGLVFGKFARDHLFQKDPALLRRVVLDEVGEASGFPIVCNTPFSHADPIFAFPTGCTADLCAGDAVRLTCHLDQLY